MVRVDLFLRVLVHLLRELASLWMPAKRAAVALEHVLGGDTNALEIGLGRLLLALFFLLLAVLLGLLLGGLLLALSLHTNKQ